jgi:hypothetical protein
VKVAYLAVCALLDTFDEEPYETLKDKDDDQNGNDRRQSLFDEKGEFGLPVMSYDVEHMFILRGYGLKEHD